jgi:DNA invertase Pin-like site-specific DNA recombinase
MGMKRDSTAAIYIRKSTKQEDGRSLKGQEQDCQDRASRLGLDVVEIYREADGTSASHMTDHNRPEFIRAMEDLGVRYQTLIVWDIDRWTRKGAAEVAYTLDAIEKTGTRLLDYAGQDTDQHGHRLPMIIRAETARDEIVRLAERINRGKRYQREEGSWLGGQVPFGLAAIRSVDAPTYLVIDAEAAEDIRLAAKWIIEGATLTAVVLRFNEMGKKTSTNSPWGHTTLYRLMKSPHLIGQRLYRQWETDKESGKKICVGEDIARDENGHPRIITDPIIDEATFARVGSVMSERKRVNQKAASNNSVTRKYMLAGLLICNGCGSKLTGSGGTRKNRHGKNYTHHYYRCSTCRPTNLITMDIESFVIRKAIGFIEALEGTDSLIADEVGRRWMAKFSAGDASRRSTIQDEITVIEGRLAKLRKDHYVKGVINDDDFEDMEQELTSKLTPLEAELALLPEASSQDISGLFTLLDFGDDDGDLLDESSAWSKLEAHQKRAIIRCVIDEIHVEPGVKGKPGEGINLTDHGGRLDISFATEDNVVELAGRSEKINSKHVNRKAKLANV